MERELRRSVSLRCNCPVFIRLEQCIGGWIIAGGMFIHNHELVQNIGSSLAEASLRCIPPDLIELGDKLRRAGFTASKINQVLESECRRQGVEVSWNYQDVYNKFAPSGEERLFDATNFTEYLRKRQNDKDLYFDTTTDTDGCIEKVFWVLERGLDLWAEGYESNCVLFDTSYGTNRYFLKIGAFTTVNKYGKTVIIACSLLTNEDQESFEWLFKEFFRTTPNVMFTDGDPGMANAICLVLPRTTHLLCTFHISKNITTHIKPLFSGQGHDLKAKWTKFMKEWWKICKKQDSLSCVQFDSEWEGLLSLIQNRADSVNTGIYEAKNRWLKSLYNRKE